MQLDARQKNNHYQRNVLIDSEYLACYLRIAAKYITPGAIITEALTTSYFKVREAVILPPRTDLGINLEEILSKIFVKNYRGVVNRLRFNDHLDHHLNAIRMICCLETVRNLGLLSFTGQLILGDLYRKTQQYTAALVVLSHAPKDAVVAKNKDLLFNQAVCQKKLGNYDLAEKIYTELYGQMQQSADNSRAQAGRLLFVLDELIELNYQFENYAIAGEYFNSRLHMAGSEKTAEYCQTLFATQNPAVGFYIQRYLNQWPRDWRMLSLKNQHEAIFNEHNSLKSFSIFKSQYGDTSEAHLKFVRHNLSKRSMKIAQHYANSFPQYGLYMKKVQSLFEAQHLIPLWGEDFCTSDKTCTLALDPSGKGAYDLEIQLLRVASPRRFCFKTEPQQLFFALHLICQGYRASPELEHAIRDFSEAWIEKDLVVKSVQFYLNQPGSYRYVLLLNEYGLLNKLFGLSAEKPWEMHAKLSEYIESELAVRQKYDFIF